MTTKVASRNPKSKHTDATLPDILHGTPVLFTDRDGNEQQGIFSHWTNQNDAYIKVGGRPFWRKSNTFLVTGDPVSPEAGTYQDHGATAVPVQQVLKPSKTFNINKRFQFLAQLVKMTINAKNVSLIITGDGGLGKTKTVMDQVAISGMENAEYYVVKGYSTAKGLYNTLYYNKEKLLIFDDCDEILTNDVARNILKGALDSYDQRIVHWISNNTNDDVPNQFEFKGRIIFISNMNRNKMHQAIISRSTCIDVSMTTNEKVERMRSVLDRICPNVPMSMKEEAMEVMEQYKNETSDLNFRTLIKVINIRVAAEEGEDWREMAEYMLLA